MNKLLIIALMFLVAIPLASATPVIQNVSVQPSSAWIGEDIDMSLSCIDNANASINQVYANITGPDITLPTLYFTGFGDYHLTVSKNYFDKTGQYDVTLFCKNNLSQTASNATSFTVSRLTGYINGISPSPAYVGDIIEIDFVAEKDSVKLSSGVTFNVSLDGVLKQLKVLPAYDTNRGWILKIDSPNSADVYDLEVTAFYDRTSVSDFDTIDIRNSVDFGIVSVDKNWIKSNDNITVRLKALDRGGIIEIDENNVDIKIGSSDAAITSISKQGNEYNVGITAPSFYSGTYQLEAYLNYNGSSYSDSRSIDYVVTISGSMVDLNNKAVSTQLKFIQNGITKLSINTDAYGHYSGSIPPGQYDIDIGFPKSSLYLYDVLVNEFNDPVNYFYGDDFDVLGIRNAGLYSYELDLSYSKAEIEMTYNEKNVVDENNLKVLKCSNWNSGKKLCNDEWTEIGYELDTVRNRVKVLSSTLSAFVIGEPKNIVVNFGFDKEHYNLDDIMKLEGIVKDDDGDSVSNASINLYIKNTQLNYNIFADNNGVFSLEIPVPENDGEYTLVLKAEKPTYNYFKDETDFSVVKSRSVFIEFPDSIKIERGDNFSQEFYLLNNGQADISSLDVSLEGMPEDYYTIRPENVDLKVDERKTLYIDFSIPVYAETGISSATLKVEGTNISEEKVFGLNIFEENDIESSPTGLVTGFTLPEISYLEIIYIAVFAAFCFSVAVILKKKKSGGKRDEVRKFLSGVERYMNNHSVTGSKDSYDKLIITEFPNVMKFSKEITQVKERGDK